MFSNFLISLSVGGAALREARSIPTLLPFLKNINLQHVDLATSVVHVLRGFI